MLALELKKIAARWRWRRGRQLQVVDSIARQPDSALAQSGSISPTLATGGAALASSYCKLH
jgi:hypothetical protein